MCFFFREKYVHPNPSYCNRGMVGDGKLDFSTKKLIKLCTMSIKNLFATMPFLLNSILISEKEQRKHQKFIVQSCPDFGAKICQKYGQPIGALHSSGREMFRLQCCKTWVLAFATMPQVNPKGAKLDFSLSSFLTSKRFQGFFPSCITLARKPSLFKRLASVSAKSRQSTQRSLSGVGICY